MRAQAVVLTVALVLAPFGACAADLVVWWEKGFYPQEDAAVEEIVVAFEQKTGAEQEIGRLPRLERRLRFLKHFTLCGLDELDLFAIEQVQHRA